MYKKNQIGQIIRISDGAFIPQDEKNNDYKSFLEWQKKGNVATQETPTQKEVDRNKVSNIFEFINKKTQAKKLCDAIIGLLIHNLENRAMSENEIDTFLSDPNVKILINTLQLGRIVKVRRLIVGYVADDILLTRLQIDKIIELVDAYLASKD